MRINTIFFDLDGTLYPHNNGMWPAISENMNRYIRENFNIADEQVAILREEYFHTYGTTLRGLQDNFNVDTEAYLAFVHDIPLEEFLQQDEKLNALLTALPQKKWVLTNSDHRHSSRVLKQLGIEAHFEGIIDVWATDFHPKPDPFAFEKALEIADNPAAEVCLFVDDIPKNLIAAREHGLKTVLVANNPSEIISDFQINKIHDLLIEIPSLQER